MFVKQSLKGIQSFKPFTKNYHAISNFRGVFSPKVNSVFYPKTKRYLYLKKIKKAQGIIFHVVKTKQCMSHVSMKNETIHEDEAMQESRFYEK